MLSLPIRENSQVAEARRMARALAQQSGFDEQDIARIALVVTEIATNLVKYSDEGELLISSVGVGGKSGIDVIALDRGPGIKDLAGSLRNGYSTTGSPGTGMGAIIRQSAIFDIYTQPEKGTAVFSRVRPLQRSAPGLRWEIEIGAVCKAAPGENVSGDAWKARCQPNGGLIVIADGLGHGPAAAEAAEKAIRAFDASSHVSPASMVAAMNGALRSTRGAAVAVAQIDFTAGIIAFAGIGNISGTLIDEETTRKTMSHNGIVGHTVRSIQEFIYPCSRNTLVVLHTDGLATSWHLQAYPGLTEKHPGVVAAILYRDFTRGRDDVTVVVARCSRNA
jgi:anti-sigma regulatory factor (Ser/Thr protein kinase)